MTPEQLHAEVAACIEITICFRCGAQPGQRCKSKSGRTTQMPHQRRLALYEGMKFMAEHGVPGFENAAR